MLSRYDERSKMREKNKDKWYHKVTKKPISKEDYHIESYKINGDTKFVKTILILFFFVVTGSWVWVLSKVYFH